VRDYVRKLGTGVAIYGAGDAAIHVVNFGLLAVYVKGGFLTRTDYGALAIILAIEAFARVISRWGLDGAFMRYYHDRGDGLPRLASTIIWFLLAADLAIFGLALALAGVVGRAAFDDPQYIGALRLMLVNAFFMAFTFLPFHAMRMRNEALVYSSFTFARSIGTLVLRIVFVIGLQWGLPGMYLADLIVTLAILPVMWPWFRPYVGPWFSAADLRTALRFGLPRVPHGLAQQALDGGNKLLLNAYIPQAQLGVYQNGVTLGSAVKFFTSAFETAWAPFYYSTARAPDAAIVFRKITTYGVAVLTLLVAGATAVAPDVVLLMLTPEYLPAASILPLIAVGMACHGVYLLTSIGLNLTSRTEFYPVATFAAAAAGRWSRRWVITPPGVMGAAVAFVLAYAVQAAVAFVFAQRFYPIRYEGGRLARVLGAGVLAAVVVPRVVPDLPPLAGLLVNGAATAGLYAGLLLATGFLRPAERAFLRELAGRVRARRSARPVPTNAD
jgi:O-antigen/teichoic acid export membrane protein